MVSYVNHWEITRKQGFLGQIKIVKMVEPARKWLKTLSYVSDFSRIVAKNQKFIYHFVNNIGSNSCAQVLVYIRWYMLKLESNRCFHLSFTVLN